MKNILLSTLALICFTANAQNIDFGRLKSIIAEKAPDFSSESKLVAYNIWSQSDHESRERNKSLDKACDVFGFAKLQGGQKGIIAVAICRDGHPAASIGLSADGVTRLIALSESDLEGLVLPGVSGVFDATGKLVLKDLESAETFTSIQKLITR